MATEPDMQGLGVNWTDLEQVQDEITRWANATFPERTAFNALSKVTMKEIPELLVHLEEQGTDNIGTELADVFILLIDLAAMWEVNLPTAIRDKMFVNYERTWKRDKESGLWQHIKEKTASMPPPMPSCPTCHLNTHVVTSTDKTLGAYVCIADSTIFDDDCPF